MKDGYEKAKRVVDAAVVVLDAEAHWSAGESAPEGQPYQTDMRELRDAVDDYLTYRKKSWETPAGQIPPAPPNSPDTSN